MTGRQKFKKLIYPAALFISRLTGKYSKVYKAEAKALVPFPAEKIILNSGKKLDSLLIQHKKLLIVNTASDCGFTAQYAALEELQQKYAGKLLVIGFPANDFKQQEKENDEVIEAFCSVNFGVSFPLSKKSVVVKSADQNDIFHWLTHSKDNGWNNANPSWNFTKYLLDENQNLIGIFEAGMSPLDSKLTALI